MCSECSDKLRAKRGCFKPGYEVNGTMAWRFTSPQLKEEDRILRECPVGAVLREAPHVYDAIAAESYAEQGAFDPTEKPTYLQDAMRVIGSERSRLWEAQRKNDQAKSDAAFGARALRGR